MSCIELNQCQCTQSLSCFDNWYTHALMHALYLSETGDGLVASVIWCVNDFSHQLIAIAYWWDWDTCMTIKWKDGVGPSISSTARWSRRFSGWFGPREVAPGTNRRAFLVPRRRHGTPSVVVSCDADWLCVLVFIDDVSVTAQLKYVTPSIHATQYVPCSFHWNLAYVEMLWEKNIVCSLKSTAEVMLQNMAT